jgi:hypothetical protein
MITFFFSRKRKHHSMNIKSYISYIYQLFTKHRRCTIVKMIVGGSTNGLWEEVHEN